MFLFCFFFLLLFCKFNVLLTYRVVGSGFIYKAFAANGLRRPISEAANILGEIVKWGVLRKPHDREFILSVYWQ